MSESSLDSELLAVAGARNGKKRGRKDLSASEGEEVSSEDVSLDEESDWEDTKTTSKKKGGGSITKPARKRQARGRAATPSDSEADDDDGGGGGRQDESSEEDRLEIDEEDLIEDEEDRKRLAAMTELQREYELANRAEKRNQELLRQKLLAKQQQSDAKAERAGAKAAKRVGRVKSGREERQEAAKKSAMEELKAARVRKARGAEERARKREESGEEGSEEEEEEEQRRRRRDSSEDGALRSEDGLSDDDRQRGDAYGRHGGQDGEDEEDEAPLEDVKKIQVRRSMLELWVNEPFFEDTLPGCMVRVLAGEAPGPDGMPQKHYVLCQVVAVETRAPGWYKDSGQTWRSPYAFGPKREKTSKWLLVERGSSQRGMPLEQVSNAGFLEPEFESWQRHLREQGRAQVSRRTVADAYDRLVKANNYIYTSEDVERVLREKKAKGLAPRNIALEKAKLQARLDHAHEHGEQEAAAELEGQIAAMDATVAEAKARRRGPNMADLNKRNSDANFKNALDNVSNRVGASADAQAAAAGQLDPFSRRATRPIIYWSTKRQQQGEERAAGQDAAAPADGDEAAGGEAGQQQRRLRPDLDAIVDLSSLDLSILERPARMPPMARKLLGPTWRPALAPPGARVLSLDEYKRSKGWA